MKSKGSFDVYKLFIALILAGSLAACAGNPANHGAATANKGASTATAANDTVPAKKRCRYSSSTSSRLGNRDCKNSD